MINKIIAEENPEYMAVAFDIGKNFRREKYDFYKDGRKETPKELVLQMPYARKILKGMGIPYFELAPYEADDIIGTLSKKVLEDDDFNATIVSSDRDLLQLVNEQVDIKLLKQKGFIRYNPTSFYEEFKINPIQIIDLKALAGDASDNIPGVKGIGEKTALSLLVKYGTVENIYEHIDEIKGRQQEKLITDKEMAFISKEIATIYNEVPLDIKDLEDLKYEHQETEELYHIFEELEFYSLMKKFEKKEVCVELNNIKYIENINELNLEDIVSFYIEVDNSNYHKSNILGMALTDKNGTYYIKKELVKECTKLLKDKILYTFDLKKNMVVLKDLDFSVNYDLMLAAYLLNYTIKDDISYLMNQEGYSVTLYEDGILKQNLSEEKIINDMCLKSKYIYDTRDKYVLDLKKEDMFELFASIEMPLVKVLADMELTGVRIDKKILDEMKEEIKVKINLVSNEIYNLVGEEFNISSPKQLGEILFDKLGLPYGAKKERGYKTDVKVLHKLIGVHPVIEKILEYRNLTKIYSTYLEGLENYIYEDGKIHTIYKQNLTRTGRLSSVEPNLQNIPVKDEGGRKIRKAFIPDNDCFLSADYSQIELRILAHISKSKELIEAFNNDADIHTKVASDIYGVSENAVSKKMRSTAKAVIFGIVYGISGFGLGENLEISPKEAKNFIDKYYELYPGVKNYMDEIVKEAYLEGSVRTLFNRKRIIDELNSSNYMVRQAGERIALNTPIQGTSADIMKKAMIEIYEEFARNNIKSKIILQVHDEIIIDLLESEKELVTKIVNDKMTNVFKLSVPLKVSNDYGSDWYETK
jgi:DNA polymerase-1